MPKVKMTKQAANYLAYFTEHLMYGPTISDVIVNFTEEWAARQGKAVEDLYVDIDEYKNLQDRINWKI